jgi:hypothetical protein
MKKYTLVGLLFISLAACKKDYSCSCTETYTNNGSTSVETYTKNISGATKNEAIGLCNESVINYTDVEDPDYFYEESCKLSK